jgi:hypothetical protein
VAGADKPPELPIVEIANYNGDRQAGPKQLLSSVEDGAGAALQHGVINRSEVQWHLGGLYGQLEHQ